MIITSHHFANPNRGLREQWASGILYKRVDLIKDNFYVFTLKTANTRLKLFVTLAKTNILSLWRLHLFLLSFTILSLKIFFNQRTVKEPSSETRLRSAKVVLIIAFSWSCQILFQFPYPFTSHEWLRENLSLQYKYNIKHRSDENKVKYQLRIISWSNTKLSKFTS